MKRIEVRFPEELFEKIKEYAKAEYIGSFNQAVRDLCKKALQDPNRDKVNEENKKCNETFNENRGSKFRFSVSKDNKSQ